MAQWERLMQLHSYSQQLHELYDRDALPMDVRHYLSHWIEKQEWQRAARDPDFAMVLFQVLLENLDIQHSRFVQEESFLMQHNIRRYKHNFQVGFMVLFCKANALFSFALSFLNTASFVFFICLEHTMICLEEQQDEFDFKYQTHKMEGKVYLTSVKKNQVQLLQHLVNRLNECRKSTLSDINKLLDKADDLIDILVKKELVEWQRRQQKSCIGAPDNVCLDQLEKWFTCVAVCLFQVREFLSKLEELVGKVSYENDPLKAQKPGLQKRADALLKNLLKSSFVVETQPSMPQGKGPLVLRTNIQFSVKTRLVCHHCLFSLYVTEELHIIYFDTVFELKGMSVDMLASSLPVVIISNSSQQQSAWASILWFNMLSQDTKDIRFFAGSPTATWLQFGEMLSWQLLSATKLGLNKDQLDMIGHRLFGKQQNYNTFKVAWSKFSKENTPFTFWVWFDGIVVMVKSYLEDLWRDGLIMGFVTKGKEKALLKKKQRGTFLLRFSESVIGGITFSWVETTITGEPEVKTVQPFTKDDLSQVPFHEIIRNFQILETDNVPENPLLYLYPNIPKDEAFGKVKAWSQSMAHVERQLVSHGSPCCPVQNLVKQMATPSS
uniref:Signal transducer and activator of transcription n=1 Tax=Sphaeramia orbicularis TaxID=375764 RepID=A0A673CTL7_9TELE